MHKHALASGSDDAVRRPTKCWFRPWQSEKDKKKPLKLLSCVHRFGSVGVLHFTDALAILRAPRRFKGKKKKKLLIFFGIETKPKGHFRSRSNSSCEPTKCLHISRIDAGACTPPPTPNHEKWNPITKMQLKAVNYHLYLKSVRPTIVAHSTISDATH